MRQRHWRYSVRSWRCTKWSGSLPMNNAPGKLCSGRPACQLELLRFCPEEPIRSRSSLALPALVTKCGPLALEQRACRHHLFLNAPRWAHGRGAPAATTTTRKRRVLARMISQRRWNSFTTLIALRWTVTIVSAHGSCLAARRARAP